MTPEDSAGSTYTLRRVQAMLGLSRTVIARMIAEGFVKPARGKRNEHRFTFQDLMLLRTAHALQASSIPPRKILRSLARLKARLPRELPLTGLRITAIGAEVAVRDGNGQWQADSGQLLMDFEVTPAAGEVTFMEKTAVPPPAASAASAANAANWFERGAALEATDPRRAEDAYRQALALAPDHGDAWLNLGAMLCEASRFAEVVELSRQALVHCPDLALIHFNHAVALDNLEQLDEAVASYERSLKLDPTLADAHYNLARLQERVGDERGALRHFSAYRRLQP